MKTCKNILLISGITSVMFYIVLSVVRFITYLFTPHSSSTVVIYSEIIPIIITVVLLIMPTFFLIRSLKNKTGKALPFICIIIEGFFLLLILFNKALTPINFYMFYSKLGLVDTYIPHIISYWTKGTLFLIIGICLIISASILSLFKQKEKQAVI